MRKRTLYPRLAAANLLRNKSTYLPYLLACVVTILSLYTLTAINMNGALDNLPQAASVKMFTSFGTIVVAIFSVAMVFYTNSFLAKRRKRELGLYSMLGMTKGNIGAVVFFESLFIDLVALVLGLLGGILLERLIFVALLRLVRYPVDIQMPVTAQPVLITALFFGVVFALALLANLWGVKRVNPVELMAGSRVGEREPKASWVLTIIGIVTLVGGYGLALWVQNPMQAIALFFVAAFLVIIGTFCLFTSGSIALLKLMKRKKSYYYTPGHFISVSGMMYRMKQNAAGLASICVLSCMVLFTVSFTVALQVGGEEALSSNHPYDHNLRSLTAEQADTARRVAEESAAATGAQLEGLRQLREYNTTAIQDGEGGYTSIGEYGEATNYIVFRMIPLADYNAAEGKSETLAPGQALVFSPRGGLGADTLTLDGVRYDLRQIEDYAGREADNRVAESHTLVLPDMAAIEGAVAARPAAVSEQLTAADVQKSVLFFDVGGSAQQREAFEADFLARAGQAGLSVPEAWTKSAMRESWYTLTGGFLFLGLYLGVIFLLAAAMIIYYKQLSEGYDDRERFEILQKVGMSQEEVKKTISGQIRAVFFLPLGVAVVHIIVAFFPASLFLAAFGVTNPWVLALSLAITVVVYALVYLFVYRQTARTYYGLVRRKAA